MEALAPVLTFVISAFVIHLVSCGLVIWRYRKPDCMRPAGGTEPLTVLSPVCGCEPNLARTLASAFTGRATDYEIIFCVADPDDLAIPIVKQVMADHQYVPSRLLIGDDRISDNPKLNNLAKGWEAALHPWIVTIDSNVLLPRDYIHRLFESWGPNTGLVTSPPVGTKPQGFAAHLEAAFLNTYQDVWQLAGDQLGQGFAQGKVLFWRRDILESAGGLAALGRNMAEDVAATKVVRATGRRISVVARPFAQPLGRRTFSAVFARQVRWAKVRKDGFPLIFAMEILTGGALPLLTLGGLTATGAVPASVASAGVVVWYGTQWLVAWRAGWVHAPAQVAAWILRDLLIPAIWMSAYLSRGFIWRGHEMGQPSPQPTHVG
ncbi:MAG: glycosyltransferase [Alphaproteobacteria bacterium]|nr:glycosyltransferase [Alphaproteobacteria bacterium]